MAGRGGLQALTDAQRAKLLALATDEERVELVQDLFGEEWNDDWMQETDKAWATSADVLDEPPASLCILGGRPVLDDEGDDPECIIRLVEPDQVAAVAAALAPTDRDAFLARYAEKCLGLTAEERAEGDDLVYAWGWFEAVKAFYARVAGTGRAVIFRADL